MSRKRAKGPRKKTRKKTPAPKHQEMKLEELKAIIERTVSGPLSIEDRMKLVGAVDTLAFLTQELETKGTSIKRLRKLIFGASTEKTSQVVGKTSGDTGNDAGAGDAEAQDKPKPKRKGHGKNGAADYQGAEQVKVPHESLKRGDPCPECPKGKLYPMKEPAVLVRVTGTLP